MALLVILGMTIFSTAPARRQVAVLNQLSACEPGAWVAHQDCFGACDQDGTCEVKRTFAEVTAGMPAKKRLCIICGMTTLSPEAAVPQVPSCDGKWVPSSSCDGECDEKSLCWHKRSFADVARGVIAYQEQCRCEAPETTSETTTTITPAATTTKFAPTTTMPEPTTTSSAPSTRTTVPTTSSTNANADSVTGTSKKCWANTLHGYILYSSQPCNTDTECVDLCDCGAVCRSTKPDTTEPEPTTTTPKPTTTSTVPTTSSTSANSAAVTGTSKKCWAETLHGYILYSSQPCNTDTECVDRCDCGAVCRSTKPETLAQDTQPTKESDATDVEVGTPSGVKSNTDAVKEPLSSAKPTTATITTTTTTGASGQSTTTESFGRRTGTSSCGVLLSAMLGTVLPALVSFY